MNTVGLVGDQDGHSFAMVEAPSFTNPRTRGEAVQGGSGWSFFSRQVKVVPQTSQLLHKAVRISLPYQHIKHTLWIIRSSSQTTNNEKAHGVVGLSHDTGSAVSQAALVPDSFMVLEEGERLHSAREK